MAKSGFIACIVLALILVVPAFAGPWNPNKVLSGDKSSGNTSECNDGAPCVADDAVAEAGPDQTINEGGTVHLDGSASKGSADRGSLPDIENYTCPFNSSNVNFPSEPLGSYVNFVKNGDFGTDMIDWEPHGQVSISNGFAYSGSKSLRVDGPNGTNSYVAQDIPDPGSLFLVYFWIHVVSLSDDPLVFELVRDWNPNTGSGRLVQRLEFYATETRWTAWDVDLVSMSPLTPGVWHRIVIAGDAYKKATCLWQDWSTAECVVQSGFAPFEADYLLIGDTSWQNSAGLAYLDKIIIVGTGAGTGTENPIVSYAWDLNDKEDSDGDGNYTDDVDATGPVVDATYGDNGDYIVTLTTTDSTGAVARDTATMHVLNLAPICIGINLTVTGGGDLGLRVAGRKWNTVNMTLLADNSSVATASVTRQPGSPDEQIAWIPGPFDSSKTYEAIVDYEPRDLNGSEIGGNPVWLVYGNKDNYSIIDHHTFNVQQSEKRGSKHWNHIDPWVVNLTGGLGSDEVEITAFAMDSGSDDITFTWDSTIVDIYFNDGRGPDPPDSPGGTFPFSASDTVRLPLIPGSFVDLVIGDDDGGTLAVRIDL